jgi:tetratricopeptide (TPR) repeat protein
LWRYVGDVRGLAFNLSIYGMVSAQTGAIERARQLLDESLLISGQNNDRWGVANAFNYLGEIVLAREPADLETAHYFLSESATIFRDLGARWMLVSVLNNLGQIAAAQQNIGEAKQIFLEALDMAVTDPILPAAMEALVGLADLLMQEGDVCRASEMIAQVMNHPASGQHARDKAKRLRLALETRFSTDQLDSVMTSASCQSLQMIVARLQYGQV